MNNDLEPVVTIRPSSIAIPPQKDVEPVKTIHPAKKTSLAQELAEINWYWKKDGYYGPIKGRRKNYEGSLFHQGGGIFKFFIRNPPESFLKAREWRPCIHKKRHGWYYVNITKGDGQIERIMVIQDYLRQNEG